MEVTTWVGWLFGEAPRRRQTPASWGHGGSPWARSRRRPPPGRLRAPRQRRAHLPPCSVLCGRNRSPPRACGSGVRGRSRPVCGSLAFSARDVGAAGSGLPGAGDPHPIRRDTEPTLTPASAGSRAGGARPGRGLGALTFPGWACRGPLGHALLSLPPCWTGGTRSWEPPQSPGAGLGCGRPCGQLAWGLLTNRCGHFPRGRPGLAGPPNQRPRPRGAPHTFADKRTNAPGSVSRLEPGTVAQGGRSSGLLLKE